MAIPLESARDEIAARMAKAGAIWLGTDFDGTLTEHGDDPFAVTLPDDVRETLGELRGNPRVALAVVSGRSLADLVPRMAIPDLAYAGNHGLEIAAPGLTYIDPEAAGAANDFMKFIERLAPIVAAAPGAHIENKRLTVEVHSRTCPAEARRQLQLAVDETHRGMANLTVRHSEFGSEIRPARAGHKGTAVIRLWQHQTEQRALPFFFGDAGTDEDAFAALADGVTVKIGDGPTCARYRVSSPDDVHQFFTWLVRVLTARG